MQTQTKYSNEVMPWTIDFVRWLSLFVSWADRRDCKQREKKENRSKSSSRRVEIPRAAMKKNLFFCFDAFRIKKNEANRNIILNQPWTWNTHGESAILILDFYESFAVRGWDARKFLKFWLSALEVKLKCYVINWVILSCGWLQKSVHAFPMLLTELIIL